MRTLHSNSKALMPIPQSSKVPNPFPHLGPPLLSNLLPSRFPSLRSLPQTLRGPLTKAALMASSQSSGTHAGAEEPTKPFSVLFVCLGNICRSPAAEAVFRDLVKERSLESRFYIDSAGTINYHEGSQADSRMRAAAKRRGIEITSISRPIRPSDFKEFDLIIAMDENNKSDILEEFTRWSKREGLSVDVHEKVQLMCSYCEKHDETEVPDPYYGGPQGFEKIYLKMLVALFWRISWLGSLKKEIINSSCQHYK
ncbi:unnamed protein product [Cuscuta epithymum]|uniref:acid phosphatase n=1 Tax=Cuscuta epithymum TaxID=186058 RepID=A0AAV0GLU0_9ASTE|nr:unnamed protein product [Cuscuta epithymum]